MAALDDDRSRALRRDRIQSMGGRGLFAGVQLEEVAKAAALKISGAPVTGPGARIRKGLKHLSGQLSSPMGKKFTFLVVGKTGEGKSTLVNSLVGRKVCRTAEVTACTTTTDLIGPLDISGVQVSIYDTQGFQDGREQEEQIFDTIRDKSINLLLVCVSMLERAEKEDTRKTMAMITRELGTQIWDRAVVVLTQANERASELEERESLGQQTDGLKPVRVFNDIVAKFSQIIHGYIAKSTDSEGHEVPGFLVDSVPFLPAGQYLPGQDDLRELPDCPDWLRRFWRECFMQSQDQATEAEEK